jgi:hypothetical protein
MKRWYIYTVDYYLAIKTNDIMLFAGKWIELEITNVQWNKPDWERQVLNVFAHIQNLDLEKKKEWEEYKMG